MKTKTLAIVVVSSLIFAIANSESFAQSNGVYVALSAFGRQLTRRTSPSGPAGSGGEVIKNCSLRAGSRES